MLYTIHKSPFTSRSFESCLRNAPSGAPILLYEDGVYAATADTSIEQTVRSALNEHPIYAIQSDLQARGLTRLIDKIQIIDYATFVDLVAEHNIVPWP